MALPTTLVRGLQHGPHLLTPGRRDGAKTFLLAFLDDATRMVPFGAFYASENAACFQDALKQAMLGRKVYRRLYCDNGSTYRTHHLEVICATLSIVLIHSRPHKPRGRGKIERFFRTVRSAFLPQVTPEMLTSLATLNRVFWAWLEAEYHHTAHGGLDGKTPLDPVGAVHGHPGSLVRPPKTAREGSHQSQLLFEVLLDHSERRH